MASADVPSSFTPERSSGTALAGIGIGILGVGLIFGLDLGDAGKALGGGLMVLAASLGYAIGGFMVKRSFSSLDAIGVVTTTMGLSALLSLPVAAATPPEAAPGGQVEFWRCANDRTQAQVKLGHRGSPSGSRRRPVGTRHLRRRRSG